MSLGWIKINWLHKFATGQVSGSGFVTCASSIIEQATDSIQSTIHRGPMQIFTGKYNSDIHEAENLDKMDEFLY